MKPKNNKPLTAVNEIKSLQQIRDRKQELQKELDASKEAVVNQLSSTAKEAQTYVLRDVVLPAAGIAVGVYALVKAIQYVSPSGPSTPAPPVADAQQQLSTPSVQRPQQAPKKVIKNVKTLRTGPSLTNTLVNLGSLLIPAGKAIAEVIKKESGNTSKGPIQIKP